MRSLKYWFAKPSRFTLQGRLALGLSMAALVLISLMSIGIGTYLEDSFISALEEQLNNDSEAVLALTKPQASGLLLFAESQLPSAYQRPFSGSYLQIQAPGQLLRSRSLWDEVLNLTHTPGSDYQVETLTGPLQRPLLALSRTYKRNGVAFAITVATDLTQVRQQIQQLQRSLMIYGLASLGFMLVVQYLIVYRSLRPLTHVKRQLHQLQQGEIGRLDDKPVPEELKPLIGQFNDLLATLEQRLARSRKGLGNFAHALKTPLAVLMQLSAHSELPKETRRVLGQRTQDIHQLVDRELRRARIAGGGQPTRLLNLQPEVNDLVDTLRLIYRDRQLLITPNIARNAEFHGDRQDFQELIGNLLDNACKWAKKEVRLSFSGNAPLKIVVEDDGPGVAPLHRQELLLRGKRLDESRHGSGLGLAIVKDIVDLYQGDMALEQSDIGGLKIIISLA